MKNSKLTIAVSIASIVLAMCLVSMGCSDKAKEEAARLEEEMRVQGVADSISAARAAEARMADSLAALEPETETAADEMSESFMPPHPAGQGYTVQVAGCESNDYAEYLVGVYAKRGYEAYISTITHNDQTYYRVRIGNYEAIEPARKLVLEFQDKYSIDPWIDRIEQ